MGGEAGEGQAELGELRDPEGRHPIPLDRPRQKAAPPEGSRPGGHRRRSRWYGAPPRRKQAATSQEVAELDRWDRFGT